MLLTRSGFSPEWRKYQSAPAEWNIDAAGNSGYACLKFIMDQPQYYAYSYIVTGSGELLASAITDPQLGWPDIRPLSLGEKLGPAISQAAAAYAVAVLAAGKDE